MAVDVAALTTALKGVLVADATTGAYTIERAQRINADPARMPWLGVYPGPVSTAAHAIGTGSQRWRSEVQLLVVCQAVSFVDDGEAAHAALETILGAAQTAVEGNLSLGLVRTRVLSFSRDYRYATLDDDASGNLFLPWAVLTLTVEVFHA